MEVAIGLGLGASALGSILGAKAQSRAARRAGDFAAAARADEAAFRLTLLERAEPFMESALESFGGAGELIRRGPRVDPRDPTFLAAQRHARTEAARTGNLRSGFSQDVSFRNLLSSSYTRHQKDIGNLLELAGGAGQTAVGLQGPIAQSTSTIGNLTGLQAGSIFDVGKARAMGYAGFGEALGGGLLLAGLPTSAGGLGIFDSLTNRPGGAKKGPN